MPDQQNQQQNPQQQNPQAGGQQSTPAQVPGTQPSATGQAQAPTGNAAGGQEEQARQLVGVAQGIQGFDLGKLVSLLQALGPVSTVIIDTLHRLANIWAGHPIVAQTAPGQSVDHAQCCDACLEHLLQATAICLRHRQCC
jgi:hypothetical protein